jgi:hypothetical protein
MTKHSSASLSDSAANRDDSEENQDQQRSVIEKRQPHYFQRVKYVAHGFLHLIAGNREQRETTNERCAKDH